MTQADTHPITAEQMRRDYMKASVAYVTPSAREMAEMFAKEARIPQYRFFGKERTHSISHARQDCMRMIRDHTSLSLPQIGRIFNRDHTTVLHGIRASEKRAGL